MAKAPLGVFHRWLRLNRVFPLEPVWNAVASINVEIADRNGRPAVTVGFSHGVILATDGSLWTWGETQLGWQVLGLGSNVRTQAVLRQIGRETNWVSVSAGGATSLALKSDGTLWGWGENIFGQLGPAKKDPPVGSPMR